MKVRREVLTTLCTRESKLCFLAYIMFYIYVSYSADIPFIEDSNTFFTRLFFIQIENVTIMQTFYFLLPLVCGIVGSDVFARDIRSGMIKNLATRKPIKRIILKKSIVSFLSGGIFSISMYVFDMLIKLTLYPVVEPSLFGSYIQSSASVYGYLWFNHTWLYVLIAVSTVFLYSGLCSLTGFAVSMFIAKGIINKTSSFLIEFIKQNITSLSGGLVFSFASVMSFTAVKINASPIMIFSEFVLIISVLVSIIYVRSDMYEIL